MCAWKRGTQNNLPGVIRLGHVREFAQHAKEKADSVKTNLKVLRFEDCDEIPGDLRTSYANSPLALMCTPENGLSSDFTQALSSSASDVVFLHSHEFPHSILSCVMHAAVPRGSIVLKDFQTVNCKVCIGDREDFTLYEGESFTYDSREGAIGDTKLRHEPLLSIQRMKVSLQLRESDDAEVASLDCIAAGNSLAKLFFGCVVTIEEVFVLELQGSACICRIGEIVTEETSGQGGEHGGDDDFVIPESYRGLIDASTEVFVGSSAQSIVLRNRRDFVHAAASKNVVHVLTSDLEVFPTKRRLLRSCLALTSIVQTGKGKYADPHSALASERLMSGADKEKLRGRVDEEYLECELIKVAVDACTFDRVLLYLEHEARGDSFQFDPLIVNELYDAAISLNILGLKAACEKVLGSFEERVRRTPIRLEEVLARNQEGGRDFLSGISKKRKETLLIISGMVFDITHWLEEHPGGSTIIPAQALNVDATIFFEIYHASRQSFLYLKEFYIGELAMEDRAIVPLPTNCPQGAQASEAFQEQIRRISEPWRLKPKDMKEIASMHKSF